MQITDIPRVTGTLFVLPGILFIKTRCVTRALLVHLCPTFPAAEHASECVGVLEAIKAQLERGGG